MEGFGFVLVMSDPGGPKTSGSTTLLLTALLPCRKGNYLQIHQANLRALVQFCGSGSGQIGIILPALGPRQYPTFSA